MPYLLTLCAVVVVACSEPSPPPTAEGARDTTGVTVPAGDTVAVHTDWTRFGWDATRSSAAPVSTGITAANVGALKRQQITIDGTVDASAIYLHAVPIVGRARDAFFITTTYGKTLAIDADSGTVLWEYTPTTYASYAGSYRITNATPVADPDRQFIYAASPDGHVQKLAVADGHVVWSTAITLLPQREKIASSLNVYHGNVIATTGGYIGDQPPYQGHVAILDAATGQLLHVWNSLCSDRPGLLDPQSCSASGSAIWGRAGAVIDTTTGDILVATGNATWNGTTDWGDAVIELDPTATRIVGNYTPSNTAELSASDADVGSTSPALLGGGYVAQGGKDGTIRLLDASVMHGAAAHKGGELQSVSTPSGSDLFTAPAVLHAGATTLMFVADGGGTQAWRFTGGRLASVWKNGTGGTSPVVAGGLLYVYDPGGGIHVYDPATGTQIGVLPTGRGHWNSPIVIDGRILLPEGSANDHATTGTIDIWRAH